MKTSIEFINHASVIIKKDKISILSDPWFEGDAFHKGWNLLHETKELEIKEILNKVTHIWISHEHPDHFSVLFFKKFKSDIIRNSIEIFFQKTKDKRVFNFLKNQEFNCRELEINNEFKLSNNFSITCLKDGFYDSALLVNAEGEKILNLNDCEINSQKRINEIKEKTGQVDVLLTQFSFAAWKGGKKNIKWRKEAAKEKIETIKLQIKNFRPNYTIPFASFIYFSNFENSYLNDSINRPKDLLNELKDTSSNLTIMKPHDVLGGKEQNISNVEAINFWEHKYNNINKKKLNYFEQISFEKISDNFKLYCQRIEKNNNIWFMEIIRFLSPISVFKPVIVELSDLKINIEFDYLKKKIFKSNKNPQIIMKSESLDFLFKNNFGFDTLTVNGCFEEKVSGGFVYSTKSLAVENLNNLGINITPKIFFNYTIIKLFLERLSKVSKKIKYKNS